MDNKQIEQELQQVRKEREAFIRQAERQIAMLDGAIFALEKLLKNDTVTNVTTGGEGKP